LTEHFVYCILVYIIVCQPKPALEIEHVLTEWIGPSQSGRSEEVSERPAYHRAIPYHN